MHELFQGWASNVLHSTYSPFDPPLQLYTCFSQISIGYRAENRFKSKSILYTQYLCQDNLFHAYIFPFFLSFFLFFHSNNFKSIIRIVISSRKNGQNLFAWIVHPFSSPFSLSRSNLYHPSWISTGFQCRFGYYTLSITFSIGSSR